ncbi:MAG: hypothetical protein Q9167_003101 [Letrouitia subvulpina]
MLDSTLLLLSQHCLVSVSFVLILYLLNNRFKNGLQKYPGPFLASLTDWWRFFDVLGRRPDITQIRLHKKHGDIVRLGPNVLSFADPGALKTIYGLNKGFVKQSEFYPVQQAISKGSRLPSLFSTTDEQYHAQLRKSVNGAFSMGTLIQYERFVDETTKIGQIPTLDKLLLKNPVLRLLDKYNVKAFPFPVVKFARDRMQERLHKLNSTKVLSEDYSSQVATGRGDLLSMFLKAKDEQPGFFHDSHVLTMAVSMAFAGSETTAISLAAVFYYLIKNPRCYQKLLAELDDAVRNGSVEDRPTCLVSWAESQKLLYLDACIKEAFRLHPAAGLPLERVVPPQGMKICGEQIAGGTIVGCNAWVIHRRPEVFGNNVDDYRPERWLEVDQEKRKEMEGTMFQFGKGARTCIGKNISLLEIYKLVPSFLRKFKVELANPEQEWKLHNAWFVKQLNFNTIFTPRKIKSAK